MADLLLDFTALTSVVNPYLPDGWIKPTGSLDAKIEITGTTGRFVSTNATNAIILCNSAPVPVGNKISGNVISGDFTADGSASRGGAIMAPNGDGYFFIIRAFDLRVFKTTPSGGANSLTQIGATITVTGADNDDWYYEYDVVTGLLEIKQNTVSRFTVTDTTHIFTSSAVDPIKVAALRLGVCSRAALGKIRSVTVHGITVYAVTSINGGNPIAAGQTNVGNVTTGFTGLPTSITTNADGLTCGSIGGTTNAPTFTLSDRVDAEEYPKNGTSVTFTFTKGAEVASASQIVNKKATETAVAFAVPDLTTQGYLGAAIYAATGRALATGDEGYYTVGSMAGLVVAPDGKITSPAGTFGIWIYTAATGINYFYSVTVSADGEIVGGGLGRSVSLARRRRR